MKTINIAVVNDVDLQVVVDDKNQLIPVKPVCIPLRYFPIWVSSINANNVKEELRESILEYQKKCTDILYDYFFNRAEFALKKEVAIASTKEVFDEKTEQVRIAKSEQKMAEADYKKALNLTFEQYEAERSQLKLPGFE